jgi:DNA-binding transcriptional regulator YhcF (GntR family)
MIDIKLGYHSSAPFYQQITGRMRQLIAAEQFKSGERLPSIRRLSRASNSRHVMYNM